KPSAVLFIDLNGFKPVNDAEGHETGDRLLQVVAQRMQSQMRDIDIVARMGGDEFVMLIKNTSPTRPMDFQIEIEHLLNRLVEQMSEPVHINDKKLSIGVSIGVAVIPKDGNSVNTILKSADAAMYQAKKKCKDKVKSCYHFYDEHTKTDIDNLLKSSAQLKQAITENQFMLYYQFQYDSNTNKVVGMEAFLRWHHPETHKILAASEFITNAYNTNNINEIDEWVIKTVANDIHKMNQKGIKPPPISINLSTQKLEESTLPSFFVEAIKRNFISASELNIEITESALLHDLDKSTRTLKELSEIGIKVCIDNFGTGYSSLSYIQALPIKAIKIDKSFIENIATSHSALQMCQTFIQLGKTLKLNVIAEGVQTELQSQILQKEGCHIVQGYLFSQPKPIEKIIEQLGKEALSTS
ncbi:MAG: bifunctional diguanylate cyclase/phosphodiesterase, partial [Thiomicrorhabdus sp.]|nr:bifunctional diguanylate cyclase/phosphodiesterase [Thiomicrorhabdus sp.]